MKIDPSRLAHLEAVAERAAAEIQGLSGARSGLRDELARANVRLQAAGENHARRSRHSFPGSPSRSTPATEAAAAEEEADRKSLRELKEKVEAANAALERNQRLLAEAVERHQHARQLADRCREYVTNGKQEAAR